MYLPFLRINLRTNKFFYYRFAFAFAYGNAGLYGRCEGAHFGRGRSLLAGAEPGLSIFFMEPSRLYLEFVSDDEEEFFLLSLCVLLERCFTLRRVLGLYFAP